MPRPTALTIDALSKVLSPVAQSASELASRLGVSRATVHRKLLELAKESIVVKSGQGPRAGYRLPTVQEELERSRLERLQPGLLRMEMSERQASLLQASLELMSRLGIAQFEQLEETCRFACVRRSDGEFPFEELDRVRARADALKGILTGFSPNASHSILSRNVHPSILLAWQLSKALRHRIAWDRQPRGSLGVWHDEPVVEGPLSGFDVYSQQVAGERCYFVELTTQRLEQLKQACDIQAWTSSGKVGFLVDWAREGILRNSRGELAGESNLASAQELVRELDTGIAALSLADTPFIRDVARLAEQLERYLADPNAVLEDLRITTVDSSPFALTIEDAPEGMLLNFHKGKYRVIGPSQRDGALVIVGESHSIQTALAMARNYKDGERTRSVGF